MIAAQHDFITALARGFFADRPRQSVSDWCVEHLRFNEPNNVGPFSLAGREYIREPLDAWADPTISDMVDVFGSQAGKSAKIMGGAAWTVENNPSRIFWVMPTRDTVRGFSKTRWLPMVRASRCLADKIPVGRDRHRFTTCQQQIAGSIIDMVWSNSPSVLAGTPAPVVILDEVDKFNSGTKNEADAVNLAEQRTKHFASPKRVKSSTPTLVTGLIWQEFLKTDQRRRFMPCPYCSKLVVLAWSKAYTVFHLTGAEAFLQWDKEAKRADGTWDLDRVERSARAACPHCAGHIRDEHKTRMDREGKWQPTTTAARGYRGWHLSSLYAASAETSFGKMARKFLQAQQSLLGVQGFINGDLAEPYLSQDTMGERIELISRSMPESPADGHKLLTVDCQAKSYFYVARNWTPETTVGLEAGEVQTVEELREVQERHAIPDVGVFLDSGFGARSDAEVYGTCARHSSWTDESSGRRYAIGWTPCKGMPSRKRWRHPETGQSLPWTLARVDPFAGSSDAGSCYMNLFEFSGDYFKDILAVLRGGRRMPKWSVLDTMASDRYWHHMDAEMKTVREKRGGFVEHVWIKRSKHWPNHWYDCEIMQLAQACFFGFLSIENLSPNPKAPSHG